MTEATTQELAREIVDGPLSEGCLSAVDWLSDEAAEDLKHKIAAALTSRTEELERERDRLGQLLAHVHLHMTNDENFDADELEADIRKVGAGKWVDTESILIRERARATAAEADAARLREALTFYAKQWRGNMEGDDTEPGLSRTWQEPTDELLQDEGDIARQALTPPPSRGEKDADND